MTIQLTWKDFDKTIFITPKNIKKLMQFGIGMTIDFGNAEKEIAYTKNQLEETNQKVTETDDKIEDQRDRLIDVQKRVTANENNIETNRVLASTALDGLERMDARVRALEKEVGI